VIIQGASIAFRGGRCRSFEKGVEPKAATFLGFRYFGEEVVRQMYSYRTEEVAAG
jgi:hypothetical protein